MPRFLSRLSAAAVAALSIAACATPPAPTPRLVVRQAEGRSVQVKVGLATRQLAYAARTPLTSDDVKTVKVTLTKTRKDGEDIASPEVAASDTITWGGSGFSFGTLTFGNLGADCTYRVEARAYDADGMLISKEPSGGGWTATFDMDDDLVAPVSELALSLQLVDVEFDGVTTPTELAEGEGGAYATRHGVVAAIAGGGTAVGGTGLAAQIQSVGDIAVAPTGAVNAHDVFISDPVAKVVWRVDHETRAVSAFMGVPGEAGSTYGPGQAPIRLTNPRALAFDANGILYVVDRISAADDRLLRVDASKPDDWGFAQFVTYSDLDEDEDNYTERFHGIADLAVDGRVLYVTEKRFKPTASAELTVVDTALAVDAPGRITHLSPSGLTDPKGVAIAPDGAIWVAGMDSDHYGELYKFTYDRATHTGSGEARSFYDDSGEWMNPSALAFDSDGVLWTGCGDMVFTGLGQGWGNYRLSQLIGNWQLRPGLGRFEDLNGSPRFSRALTGQRGFAAYTDGYAGRTLDNNMDNIDLGIGVLGVVLVDSYRWMGVAVDAADSVYFTEPLTNVLRKYF